VAKCTANDTAAAVHQTSAGIVIVGVRGEIDNVTVPRMGAATNADLVGASRRLALDLDQVRILGSAGRALLLTTRARCEQETVDFALRCSSRSVLRIMSRTGVLHLFTVLAGPEVAEPERSA
jgi:anti-anti-sigma factor